MSSTFPQLVKEVPHDLPAADLAAEMLQGFSTLEELTKKLDCTPDDLADTLASEDLAQHLGLRLSLTNLNLKCLAMAQAPAAFARLTSLMDADKPEVARRAATTILALAGIASSTAADTPVQPTLPKPDRVPPEQANQFALIERVGELQPFTPQQIKRILHARNTDAWEKIFTEDQYALLLQVLTGVIPLYPQHVRAGEETYNRILKRAQADEARQARANAQARAAASAAKPAGMVSGAGEGGTAGHVQGASAPAQPNPPVVPTPSSARRTANPVVPTPPSARPSSPAKEAAPAPESASPQTPTAATPTQTKPAPTLPNLIPLHPFAPPTAA